MALFHHDESKIVVPSGMQEENDKL